MDGILNIYKERGFTSHDVVAKLRGICKMRRIGHTGTLDPDAEGVLPVCLGKATKLCELLTDKEKEYRAVMRLGVVTDTQDMSGSILEEHPVSVSEEEVIRMIGSFVGEYDQIPPMYSALKVNGKKLYELARAGQVVEREPRRIRILSIGIDGITLPTVTMTVACSKGTYIRTLCHDIGQRLGCGAAMESLLRTRSGRFSLEGSITLGQAQRLMDEGRLEEYLMPLDGMFLACRRMNVEESGEKLLYNGNPLPLSVLSPEEKDVARETFLSGGEAKTERGDDFPDDGEAVRIYDRKGQFIGLYRYQSGRRMFRPETIFLGKS